MARYAQYDFYQQSPSTLDVPPSEEDEMSVLDDKILDSTPRPAYDTDTAAFSHRNSVWSNYSHASAEQAHSQSRPSHLPHSVLDSTGAQFMPVDGPQPFAQPQASWSLSRTASGSCTPTAYDQYPSETEHPISTP